VKAVKYSETTIVRVDKEGMNYLDDDGNECFVDFRQCHASFQKGIRQEIESGNVIQLSMQGSRPRYIGFRQLSSSPPYIEILADPPVRFQFEKLAEKSEIIDGRRWIQTTPPRGWGEFQGRLAEIGMGTIDMD
jgi:hypothetical protein